MTKFLSKDPAKALKQVTEQLYDRVSTLRQCVPDMDKIGWEPDLADALMADEITFLENLLDKIERR